MAMVATYGVDVVAGFGIAMRIEPVALIPFYALSAVSSPFFGQNFAAAKYERLIEARRVVSRFCLRFGLILAAALCLVAVPLSGLFTDSMAIRKRSLFSLGYDHRIVDGADAARFLARLKEMMENFPEDA